MSGIKQSFAVFSFFCIVICSASFAGASAQEITIMVNEDATATVQQKITLEAEDQIVAIDRFSVNLLCENFWNFSISPSVEHEINGNEVTIVKQDEEYLLNYSADCLISKNGEKWTVGFDIDNDVKKVVIYLPKNSSITNFDPAASIKFQNPHMVVIWGKWNLTENYVSVEYKKEHSSFDYSSLVFLVLIAALVLVGFFYWKRKGVGFRKPEKSALKGLAESEKKIMEIIERDEGISQKLLQERAGLPKATLSRVLHKLQEKGFIEVVQSGYTNKLYLREELKKET